MHSAPDGISTAFRHWQQLTDDYVKQLEALQRRQSGALATLDRIGVQLAAYRERFTRDFAGQR